MFSKKLLFVAVAAACAAPAMAADDGVKFNFSGFGTAGLSTTNNDYTDFVRPGQPKQSSFGLDSNLGLQANAEFNKMFSATAQVLTRRDYSDDFKASLDWAFIKAVVAPGVSVRVGRVALPAYLISDARNLGYANIAIRPPQEVYGQVPMSTFNGIDLTVQHEFGEVALTAQLGYGNIKNKYSSVDIKGDKALSFNVTAETGPFVFRVAHFKTDLTVTGSATLAGLVGTLKQVGFSTLANDLDPTKKAASFTGVGMSMDYKNILLQSELTRRKTDSYIDDSTGKYVLAGYRIGDFVPYVGYATLKVDSSQISPIPHGGPLLPLALGVDGLLAGTAQSSNTIGVRWNFASAASLKVQMDSVKPEQGTGGYFANSKAGYKRDAVRVLSAAVDFVF